MNPITCCSHHMSAQWIAGGLAGRYPVPLQLLGPVGGRRGHQKFVLRKHGGSTIQGSISVVHFIRVVVPFFEQTDTKLVLIYLLSPCRPDVTHNPPIPRRCPAIQYITHQVDVRAPLCLNCGFRTSGRAGYKGQPGGWSCRPIQLQKAAWSFL